MQGFIAPSILAADFSKLGELVHQAELGGANRIHIDVMDGHFVPNLSMGPVVVKGLRPVTKLPLEVHLMVEKPAAFFNSFLHSGADSIIFHHEVVDDGIFDLIEELRATGKKVGVAINPGTPVEVMEPYIDQLDLALCMTVWPGFGGQAFLPESPDRIAKLRHLINRLNPKCELEVDGGIDEETIATACKSGANVFVAGTAIFGSTDGTTAATKRLGSLVNS
jgi:ribulose-phosphate 3-epimerase